MQGLFDTSGVVSSAANYGSTSTTPSPTEAASVDAASSGSDDSSSSALSTGVVVVIILCCVLVVALIAGGLYFHLQSNAALLGVQTLEGDTYTSPKGPEGLVPAVPAPVTQPGVA